MVRKIFFLILSFYINNLYSQDTQIFFESSKYEVDVNESFKITLKIINDSGNIAIEQLPELDPAIMIVDAQQSQEIGIVQSFNSFKKSAVFIFTYKLKISKPGDYLIGPFVIKSNSNTYNSDILKIKVVQSAISNNETIQYGYYFIKADQSKTEIYQDEFIDLDVSFFYANNYRIIGGKKLIYPTSAWVENININDQKKEKVIINNMLYYMNNLSKDRIYISKPGKYILDPYEYYILGYTATDNFASQDKFLLKTKPVEIIVKNLPSGKPGNFAGAVGVFSLSSEINQTRIRQYDAATLKVTLEGEGNFYNINEMPVVIPDSVEKYTAKSSTDTADYRHIKKVWEVILVPQKAGKVKVKVDDFSFFNTAVNDYRTIGSRTYILEVSENEKKDNADKKLKDTEKIIENKDNTLNFDVIKKEINYIKLNLGSKNNVKNYNVWFASVISVYLLLLLLTVLILLYRLFFMNLFNRLLFDDAKNAFRIFMNQARKLKTNFNDVDINEDIEKLSGMLENYLLKRFGLKSIDYTKIALEKKFREFFDPDVYNKFNELTMKLNMIRFGSDKISSEDFSVLADSIIDFVKNTENQKKRADNVR